MKLGGLFDFFSVHRKWRGASLLLLTLVLAALVTTLHFSEDISDFLPLGTREREQLSIYQNISGAQKIFVLFSNPGDADETVEAVESFVQMAEEGDSTHRYGHLAASVDMETIAQVAGFVYANIPYFLTEADVARMDSLLADPGAIRTALSADKQALLFPASELVSQRITHDPVGLFSPVLSRLQSSYDTQSFELYNNCIFTPDMSRAIVLLDSPFGSSETSNNARLMAYLHGVAQKLQAEYPRVGVDFIGGPAIAVGNASRIKKDSILAISLSAVLIILLLLYSFNSLKNILLIFLTVGWGLLFALGGMALFSDRVSIIVIGIASVILGIAINYPLHLISHTAHQPDRRKALREIISPLVIGNVTTVGAFMALVPLQSTALRDLGLFASLLLVGTILFVLLYLPHYVANYKARKRESRVLDRLAAFSPEKHRWLVVGTLVLTAVLLFFSFGVEFDSNMSHINYMTDSQRRDMQYFEDLLAKDTTHTALNLYVYGSGADFEDALEDIALLQPRMDSLSSCGKISRQNEALLFFASRPEQERRLLRWNAFRERHQDLLPRLKAEAVRAGFAPGAFAAFEQLMGNTAWQPQDFAYFSPLRESVFSQSFAVSEDGKKSYVVSAVNVEPGDLEAVKAALGDPCFEIAGINRTMTGSLSDNFNYIGWACSLIVFFFLWFSFGRLELAVISFIPMAVSWVWILGLMALLGIPFNIVNIILATFIFGQGDDYTIFMTEGCQYEYARRQPILTSYKSSILQSAAIMFVGIGTLIVARHPAMRSLAEVTIIGMFSVVLMAYLIPPLLFQWMTTKNGRPRLYPLTLSGLLRGVPTDPAGRVEGRYIYKGIEVERCVRRNLRVRGPEILGRELPEGACVEFADEGYGELALLLALSHPRVKVIARIPDEERRRIAQWAAEDMVENLTII